MIQRAKELTDPIRSAVNRRSVIFAHVLLGVTVLLHTLLSPSPTSLERILLVVASLAFIVFVMVGLFDLTRVNKWPIPYIVVAQLTAFFTLAFLSTASTPYVLALFIVVCLSNLYYGNKGVWLSIVNFGVITLIKLAYLSSTTGTTLEDKLNILVAFLLFASACIFFINVQKIFDWDHSRLKDTLKEAAVEEKRLRALINNMTETVLVLDKEGVIRLYNAAALAMFDTNNSLSDKPLDGFARFEDEKGKIIAVSDLMPPDNKPVVRSDVWLRYGPDDKAALSMIVTPIYNTFGQEHDESGFVMTLRDITHEKSLEEERDEFISVISHELRTPVTVAEAGVSNALLIAEKMENGEKIKASLTTAHDQAVYLANMLNDLSTFARAEKGTLEMNLEEFEPRELLDRLMEDYRNAVEAKKMQIVCRPDETTPLRMVSNRLYIREILQNFITNSIKYSDKGTITLSSRARDKGILFSVSDEGIGISTADQKKVFEKFFRAEDYRTRSSSGTGLGLYIVKKLGKILDATFEIKSEVGKGSTFSIYVPDQREKLDAKHERQSNITRVVEQPKTPPPITSVKATHPTSPSPTPSLANQREPVPGTSGQVSQTPKS